jgi:hypothetical protein
MPACTLCGTPAVVQWQRRPTDSELAALIALDNPGIPPTATNTTVAVYACVGHSIAFELASLVHQSSCSAPDPVTLPDCNCTPEKPAVVDSPPEDSPLPPDWQ